MASQSEQIVIPMAIFVVDMMMMCSKRWGPVKCVQQTTQIIWLFRFKHKKQEIHWALMETLIFLLQTLFYTMLQLGLYTQALTWESIHTSDTLWVVSPFYTNKLPRKRTTLHEYTSCVGLISHINLDYNYNCINTSWWAYGRIGKGEV